MTISNFSNSNAIEAPELDYLYIGLSQLPNAGQGLFTAIDVYKDEIIAIYKGEIIAGEEVKRREMEGNDKYFINLPDGKILDSMHTKCFAKYANDAKGLSTSNYKNNAKIALDDDGRVCLIAKKQIKEREEIFCSYGKRYWKKYR
ncbi:MAG: SET domain-containing protein-lysine N-methyltransferase [Saprospiraceae bacterium]|nr:SET domain-containing protein-lysine N-methyltransferase [Saprospiraceae bacterium]